MMNQVFIISGSFYRAAAKSAKSMTVTEAITAFISAHDSASAWVIDTIDMFYVDCKTEI